MSGVDLSYGLPSAPDEFRRQSGLVSGAFFTLHEVTEGPDAAARIGAIEAGLTTAGLRNHLTNIRARDALESEICMIHLPAYFRQVRSEVLFGAGVLSTGDTELSEYTMDVALRATGGVLTAVDAVITGKADTQGLLLPPSPGGIVNAFCAVRPPGHHATPTRGMGFCVFNHVAIAARYAQKRYGIGKILIVDWDVHHGNGTQEAFYSDDSILFFSSHQDPLFPGTGRREETGEGPALGQTINAPLPPGSGYREILGEIETRLEPTIPRFKPELILISAGFDARAGDPLGAFTLTDDEFSLLTRRVMDWAEDYCNGRIVSVLEGGYNLQTLGGAVAAHVAALASYDDE